MKQKFKRFFGCDEHLFVRTGPQRCPLAQSWWECTHPWTASWLFLGAVVVQRVFFHLSFSLYLVFHARCTFIFSIWPIKFSTVIWRGVMFLVGWSMYFANFPTILACIPDIHYGLVDIRGFQIQEAASMIQKFLPSLCIPVIQGPGHFIPLNQTAFRARLLLGRLLVQGWASTLGTGLNLGDGPLHFTSLLAGPPKWGRASTLGQATSVFEALGIVCWTWWLMSGMKRVALKMYIS